jgi:hypothetical protein
MLYKHHNHQDSRKFRGKVHLISVQDNYFHQILLKKYTKINEKLVKYIELTSRYFYFYIDRLIET